MQVIEKNSLEQIQIQWKEYKGVRYLDIRVYFQDKGGWEPTRKGVTLKPDQVQEMIDALQLQAGVTSDAY